MKCCIYTQFFAYFRFIVFVCKNIFINIYKQSGILLFLQISRLI